MRLPPFLAEVGFSKRVDMKNKPGKSVVFGQFKMMGMTLELPIPEEFVPDMIEGKKVELELALESGKWNKPQVRLIGVKAQ